MKIYQLTKIGRSLARTPTRNLTPSWKVLYFLRRRGGAATDDQIVEFAGINRDELRVVTNELLREKAVTILS